MPIALCAAACAGRAAPRVELAPSAPAPAHRPVVTARADGSLVCEAEDFVVRRGWRAMPWGTNYFAATFADTFLSRKAYLSAEPDADDAVAVTDVDVARAGHYLVLARYEHPYRYESRFRVTIRQHGARVFDRTYGALDAVKIWPFSQHHARDVQWPWGASEDIVWEGDDAAVDLAPGRATITLRAEHQAAPAARRNVDAIVLTTDAADVAARIAHENYLPLDGLLTQEGDLYARLRVEPDSASVELTVPHGVEHSPYWVHTRTWHDISIRVTAGEASPWTEVGAQLDSLNDGQWTLAARGIRLDDAGAPVATTAGIHYVVEFAEHPDATPIARFESRTATLRLAYDADTRRSHRVRTATSVLRDVVDALRSQPVVGPPPRNVPVYAIVPDAIADDAEYTALRDEFVRLTGVTSTGAGPTVSPATVPVGYTDLRDLSVAQLEAAGRRLEASGEGARMAVVSLGDEIPLAGPREGAEEAFRAWISTQDAFAHESPGALAYDPDFAHARAHPAAYYASQRFAHAYGIARLRELTRAIAPFVPHAGIGANFSPHVAPAYVGATAQWISAFEQGALTMPWSEDYIWGIPVGTPQMNFLGLDEFRAGLRGRDDARLLYYVMPHSPGNTPADWRRMFYGDLAHGMNMVDLFEFRPVQLAYTENYVNGLDMYRAVRRGVHELGRFDDLVAHGHVRAGEAALWFGETADIWHDGDAPFAAGKRTLYIAARHAGLALDVVDEDAATSRAEVLSGYRVLFLADAHVSRAATAAIARWVDAGGRLFATAGAGLRDEYDRPNAAMAALLGVNAIALDAPADQRVVYEKQDLPWVAPMDTVRWSHDGRADEIPVFGARSRVAVAGGGVAEGTFASGGAAVVRHAVGRGQTLYAAFLPGLSYFQPALPQRPVDRATTDDGYDHFIPSAFDPSSLALVAALAHDVPRALELSAPRVDARIVEAPGGQVIPLVNFGPAPVRALRVTVNVPVAHARVELASGGAVREERAGSATTYVLDLDVADALIAR